MSDKKEPKELFTEILGKRIKEIREKQNKSLLDVAYMLKIEPNSLRRYEKGETLMNAFYLTKLAEILEISVDALVSGINTK